MADVMKQKIAYGVIEWLRNSAPKEITMMMDRKRVCDLVQTICDQLTDDDFVKSE